MTQVRHRPIMTAPLCYGRRYLTHVDRLDSGCAPRNGHPNLKDAVAGSQQPRQQRCIVGPNTAPYKWRIGRFPSGDARVSFLFPNLTHSRGNSFTCEHRQTGSKIKKISTVLGFEPKFPTHLDRQALFHATIREGARPEGFLEARVIYSKDVLPTPLYRLRCA
jgi:hypothetical protein